MRGMSVFTCVDQPQLEQFLAGYSVGVLRDFAGVTTGVENTNYFVYTSAGAYVLTVFERVPHEDIPFCLGLAAHLAEHGIPSAQPVASNAGAYLNQICGKPAALWVKLPGRSAESPSLKQCREVGGALARMHRAAASFEAKRGNPCGLAWARQTAAALKPKLSGDERALMESELAMWQAMPAGAAPAGVVHADLFVDNVLFEGERLCGVIDFYYACTDLLLLDLATAVNDWCKTADGAQVDAKKQSAMVDAYCEERPLSAAEKKLWNQTLRRAALRFWLSRAYDKHFPRDGEMILIKDPEIYRRLLVFHLENGRGGGG